MATTDKPQVPTAKTYHSRSGQFVIDMTMPDEEVVQPESDDDDTPVASK